MGGECAKLGLGDGDEAVAHHVDGEGGKEEAKEGDRADGFVAAACTDPALGEDAGGILVEVVAVVGEAHV